MSSSAPSPPSGGARTRALMRCRCACTALVLLALAAGCAPPPPAAPAPPAPLAGTKGFVEAGDSVRLAYHVLGSGRDTVVVLHGGPGLTGESLRPDLLALAQRRTLIFYDQRGSGYSSRIVQYARATLAHHVADLEAVRRHFGIERLVLAGHSWGGGLAVRYALAHPERVERLLLMDPLPPRREPYISEFGENLRSWMGRAARAKVAAASLALGRAPRSVVACRSYWKLFIRGYLGEPRGPIPVKGDPCAGPPENLDNEILSYTMSSLGSWDWRQEAGAVRAPVLIVHGSRDPLPVAGSREWAAALPESRLLVVEGSGHFPHAERPEVFFPAVEAFLDGRWPEGAARLAEP